MAAAVDNKNVSLAGHSGVDNFFFKFFLKGQTISSVEVE
jgi:hypothetical protein